MDKHEQIREGLRNLASLQGPAPTLLGTIKEVSPSGTTCVIKDDDSGILYYDVRLRPVLNGEEALTIYPKENAWGMAVRIENTTEWMLVACTQMDKWHLKVGEGIVEQNAEGLLIQKQNDTLRQALELIIQAVMEVVVIQGKNPNYNKLQEALTKIQNLLR